MIILQPKIKTELMKYIDKYMCDHDYYWGKDGNCTAGCEHCSQDPNVYDRVLIDTDKQVSIEDFNNFLKGFRDVLEGLEEVRK